MKVNFLVILLLIIFALPNYLTVSVYAYEEPLAKLWNVRYSELPMLLGYEKNLKKLDGLLKALLEQNDTIVGGTFIDVLTNKIHINVLNDKMNVIKHALKSYFPQYNDLFVYKPAKNSIATLRETFNQILNIANRTKPVQIICFITIQSNYIYLESFQRYDVQNFEFFGAIRQISRYNEIVKHFNRPSRSVEINNMEIDTINTRAINTLFMAGDGLYNKDYGNRCSLGFWAKSKDLKSNYFITAGHCFRNTSFYYWKWNSTMYSHEIGPMEKASEAPLDVGLITIADKEIVELINTPVIIRNTDSLYNKELIVEDDAAATSHGAHICKSGFKTHVTCGNIIGINGFKSDLKRKILYPVTFSNTKTAAGDSGGAIFSYKQDLKYVSLNGIHSFGGSTPGYIPLGEILRKFELKLISSGSSSTSSNTS